MKEITNLLTGTPEVSVGVGVELLNGVRIPLDVFG